MLIACEFSGVVREAFRRRGHNAYSCDLEPAEDGPTFHIRGDVRKVLDTPERYHLPRWDLLIAHPPCTYLCNSGVRWLTTIPKVGAPGVLYGEARRAAMLEACRFFAGLWINKVPRVCIENPIMHKHARARLVTDYPLAGLAYYA